MTPKLRLRELARKGPLSLIRKLCLPGNLRMSRSTQITNDPSIHAAPQNNPISKTLRQGGTKQGRKRTYPRRSRST